MENKELETKPEVDEIEVGDSKKESSHHSEHHHHHHHHSEHHSDRHKHKSRSKKRRNPLKNIKLSKSAKLAWALTAILFVFLAIVVSLEMADIYRNDIESTQSEDVVKSILTVEVANKEGNIVNDGVKRYLLMDILNPANANTLASSFLQGKGKLDEQVPVKLKLSVKEGVVIVYKIEIAFDDMFTNAETVYLGEESNTYEFEHLYSNTTYYYRVTAVTTAGTDTVRGHFKTSDDPRILSIDGLSNVRDIGNWRTESGKRIKQGLLIRGTEMDAAVESGYHLTNEGLDDMLNILGIKTDIDLRAQTPTSKDALGSRVEHKYYDMVQYEGIFTDYGKEKIRTVFADLADPGNYPVYLHCTYGRDRTGTVCYLLEAFLGVSRGDCLRDYGLSNVDLTDIKTVEEGLKAYGGDTLKEQATAYLLSCGVSEYQLESLESIFLGD